MVLQKSVTPVKTGVQFFRDDRKRWIPAFAGMTVMRRVFSPITKKV
jgi:hypothetical protein